MIPEDATLREVPAGPGRTFVLELPDEGYAGPSEDEVRRMAAQLEERLNGAKAIILPPGWKLRAASPYYVRERLADREREVGFATLEEQQAYLRQIEGAGWPKDAGGAFPPITLEAGKPPRRPFEPITLEASPLKLGAASEVARCEPDGGFLMPPGVTAGQFAAELRAGLEEADAAPDPSHKVNFREFL